MADGLSAVAASALPRAKPSGAWLGMRKTTACAAIGKKEKEATQRAATTAPSDFGLRNLGRPRSESFICLVDSIMHLPGTLSRKRTPWVYSGTTSSANAVTFCGTARAKQNEQSGCQKETGSAVR